MDTLKSPDTARAKIAAQARTQKRNAVIIKIMVRTFMVLSILGSVIGGFILLLTTGAGMFYESPWYTPWIVLIVVYGSFFIVPCLLSLPVVVPLAMGNKRVDRIVIFRKFNSRNSSIAIRRIIRTSVSNYGHVFTLSDSNFRIKWYIRLPLLIGQASFFHFRPRFIKDDPSLADLDKKLSDRGWLNINWLLSSGKIFSVKSTDEYWQAAAQLLLKECRLVLMDITLLTGPLEWETKVTKQQGLEESIILIASEKNSQVVQDWKRLYDTPDIYDIPLYYYDEKGSLLDKAGFEQTAAGILAKNTIVSNRDYGRLALKKVLLTIGTVCGTFLVILFFLSPYLFPTITAKHSPFMRQAVRAYVEARLGASDDEKLAPVSKRIRTKWPVQSAALSIEYAYHHNSAESDAVIRTLTDLADPALRKEYIKLVETGKPAMAEAAYSIIRRWPAPDSGQLVLRWLRNDRIDNKEMALQWIGDGPVDSGYVVQLLDALCDQHVADTSLRSRQYYWWWYRLLSRNLIPIDREVKDKDVRLLLTLLSLKNGNGKGVANLFDSYFLETWYPVQLKDSNKIYLFSPVPRPFEKITDSIFTARRALAYLPSYDSLLHSSRLSPGTELPGSYISFLLSSYPNANLNDFNDRMHTDALPLALYQYLREDTVRSIGRYLRLIGDHQQKFDSLMIADSIFTKEQLSIAWLLANIGDPGVLAVANDAAQKEETEFLFVRTHPYADWAGEIIRIYHRSKTPRSPPHSP
ncbi:MAG TPA: hypothetical protein VGN00_29850 [Puia sp.]